MHPYEIDLPPFQPFYMDAIQESSIKIKLQMKAYWYNRKSVSHKLRRLLSTYKFSTLRDVINLTLKTDM